MDQNISLKSERTFMDGELGSSMTQGLNLFVSIETEDMPSQIKDILGWDKEDMPLSEDL